MKTLITTALLALSTTTYAADICPTLGELARNTMSARQAGVPMSKIMGIAQGNAIAERIARDAFQQPRFSSDEYQTKAKEDFQAKWESICYEATAKGGSSV